MARESEPKKFVRVRPLRVQASYDLEVGDAFEMKELPLALEALGAADGTAHASIESLLKLRSRRFVNVTSDNFDSVLESVWPHL